MPLPPLPATRPAMAPRFGVITITTRQAELDSAFSWACEQVKQVPESRLADITCTSPTDKLSLAGQPPKKTLSITIHHADQKAERALATRVMDWIMLAATAARRKPNGPMPRTLNLKVKVKRP